MTFGRVLGIYTGPAGVPIQSRAEALAIAGVGFDGDRYARTPGNTHSKKDGPDREATFIEQEALDAAQRECDIALSPQESRRNVLTRGVSLNALVGREFNVGVARFRGLRLCEPCEHLEKMTRPGVIKAFTHRCGLRAEILHGGTIRVGDPIFASPRIHEWRRENFLVSTDPARLDLDAIHGFLSRSYWATGIPCEVVRQSLAHSLCFGLYENDRQIGLARAITDFAVFAWIADVFVLEQYRGRKLGVWLMECIRDCPDLHGLRRILLATHDAHTLYEKTGFRPLARPERFLERHFPDVYKSPAP